MDCEYLKIQLSSQLLHHSPGNFPLHPRDGHLKPLRLIACVLKRRSTSPFGNAGKSGCLEQVFQE